MFTFLQHLGMAPTNNAAERAIRPVALYRKEKGGLKNVKGMRRLGVILTFYETMRMRGINPHTELVKILSERSL